MGIKSIKDFPREKSSVITYLLTDIDDTITHKGRIPACAFQALEDLGKVGIKVVPITGRPAGWCDHIARMWPVDGVVGENGAFYFVYDIYEKKMMRRYFKTAQDREQDQKKLAAIKQKILSAIPGCVVSADQPYREADLAIDFAEDVHPLPQTDIDRIVDIFEQSGATAKISSIHVNGWFGAYDKLSMTKIMFREIFKTDLDEIKENVIYVGDSPNDEPMFEYFPNSVGVANVLEFFDRLVFKPAWITKDEGGFGFTQLVKVLAP
ncbi:MAG: HAD-IIB family hydrolase [Desulfobacterales bacterium]|nr:HAD-IIB family hydrolase [Desulfobacterales bacterium]